MSCFVVPGCLYHCSHIDMDHHGDEISITLWVLKGSYFGLFQRRYVHVYIVLHRSEYPSTAKKNIVLCDEWISDAGHGPIEQKARQNCFEILLTDTHAHITLYKFDTQTVTVPFISISEEHCNSTWMMFFYSFEQPDSKLQKSEYGFGQLKTSDSSLKANHFLLAPTGMDYYGETVLWCSQYGRKLYLIFAFMLCNLTHASNACCFEG